MTQPVWTYDPNIERARQALASDNPLVRRLQQQSLHAPTSASRELAARIEEYEQDLAAHLAAGGELPDQVLPPTATSARPTRESFAHEIVGMFSRPRQAEPEPTWRPDHRVEQTRRYMQSTDERERAVAWQSRDVILKYEAALRQWLAEGNALPTGVIPPQSQGLAGYGSWTADHTRPGA